MTLRDRCKAFLDQRAMDAMLRQGDPVADLVAFVIAEYGRKADAMLDETKPLVLYFADDDERAEFVALMREWKPGMMTKKLP